MSHIPDQMTDNTPHIPVSHFEPLPIGYEPIRELPQLCSYCGEEYHVLVYVSPSKLVMSKRSACQCKPATDDTAKEGKAGIDVTAELDEMFRSWNLLYTDRRTYDFSTFKKESPADEKTKTSMIAYVREYKPGAKGICFYGASGRGKTHLAMTIAQAINRNGYTALAIKSIDLLNRLRKCYQSSNQDQEVQVMRVLKNVDLLLIDDIGKEKVTGWVEEKLYEVIDSRHGLLTTIFTTDMTGEDLTKKMGQALASRIYGTGYQVQVTGRDRRLNATSADFSQLGD